MPKRFGIPQPSKYTLLSQMISDPSRDLAFASGGNIVSGITSALKAGLGTYGGLQDRRTQEEYHQSQADLQQQQIEQEKELKEKEANLGYYKLGIDPTRLNEPEYKEKVLQTRSQTPEDIKGEFAYAMNVIKSPQFQSLPKEQQDLWINFANTKAKGYETLYGQSQATALGKGAGELQYAQPIAQAKERGQQIEQLQYAAPKKLATEEAANLAASKEEFKTAYSNIPAIMELTDTLNKLADKATYTMAGRARDIAAKELLGEPTAGGTAREAYLATMRNQLLPLLRPTFGAQFTEREGTKLEQTLGDINATPQAKKAAIAAFKRAAETELLKKSQKAGEAIPTGIVSNIPTKNTSQSLNDIWEAL